jgi:hypothetical protein
MTFRHGTIRKWTGQACASIPECPCGEVFDMHGPQEVFVHVPHITAAERAKASMREASAI